MTSEESADSDFFDQNAARYGDVKPWFYDFYFVEFVKKNRTGASLLDVGAGSGTFLRLIREYVPEMQVTALDSSIRLLDQIEDHSIRKVVGRVPDLNLDLDERFFFIHVKEVLHNLVGKTTQESLNLVRESLFAIKEHLDDAGFMMIHELYWETYVVPSASRTLTFFFLSLCSKLKIRLPTQHHLRGLVVCFYSISELRTILNDCGLEIVRFKDYPYANTPLKKLLFLKQWGRMLFVVRKADTKSA